MSIRKRERQRKDLGTAAVFAAIMAVCFYISHQIFVWLPTTVFTPYDNWKIGIGITLSVCAVCAGLVSAVHVGCAIQQQD